MYDPRNEPWTNHVDEVLDGLRSAAERPRDSGAPTHARDCATSSTRHSPRTIAREIPAVGGEPNADRLS